jgi:hypothetical protein
MEPDARRERNRKGGIVAALIGVAALGLTAATTLAGFSASITNPTNTFSSGTLLLSELPSGQTTPCLSSPNTAGGITTNVNSNCTYDNFSGSTTPGAEPGGTPVSTTVVFTNTGSLASVGGLSVLAGTCSVTGNPPGGTGANAASTGSDTTGFCGKVDVQIENDTVAGSPSCLYGGTSGSACPTTMSNTYTLASLATAGSQVVKTHFAAGASQTLKITVGLDPSATNADQGLTATVPLTWSLAQ